jgi:hypothetical protein
VLAVMGESVHATMSPANSATEQMRARDPNTLRTARIVRRAEPEGPGVSLC